MILFRSEREIFTVGFAVVILALLGGLGWWIASGSENVTPTRRRHYRLHHLGVQAYRIIKSIEQDNSWKYEMVEQLKES